MQLRLIEVARAGWGSALLFAPQVVLDHVHHAEADARTLLIARVLGARHVTQAALSGVRPSPEVLVIGVWVDAAHAFTALALALLDRSRTRAGLVEMGLAGLWAVAGYRDVRTAPPLSTTHAGRRDAAARRVLRLVPGGTSLVRTWRTRP